MTDAEGRSCTYIPVRVDGRVVDSKGFTLVREEPVAPKEERLHRRKSKQEPRGFS